MPWFAVECHFTPDQVFDMPWVSLVQLTFVADKQNEQAEKAQRDAEAQRRGMRRMT